ncbi:hypothetical protein NL676_009539 [Syzygium grande]|nr:hypothetical protein NL676_009539 [Syzygium grande]
MLRIDKRDDESSFERGECNVKSLGGVKTFLLLLLLWLLVDPTLHQEEIHWKKRGSKCREQGGFEEEEEEALGVPPEILPLASTFSDLELFLLCVCEVSDGLAPSSLCIYTVPPMS